MTNILMFTNHIASALYRPNDQDTGVGDGNSDRNQCWGDGYPYGNGEGQDILVTEDPKDVVKERKLAW